MTKNTEYKISFLEIITLLKSKWKLICITMAVCMVLCGGYKIASDIGDTQDIQNNVGYETDADINKYLSEAEQKHPELLREEWKEICHDRLNNPIFSVDPYNCEYEQVVISFEDEDLNHDWTVKNWIIMADEEQLFGSQKDKLSDYKLSLIVVAQDENNSRSAETAVQVIAVTGFDTKRATDYLKKAFNQHATENGIAINKISSASARGYNNYIDKYQQYSRDKYNSISAVFNNSKNITSNLTEPTNSSNIQKGSLKDVTKICFVGLVLGFVLAFAFIIFVVVRKRELISARQVDNSFDLELLSDCSSGTDMSIDVLNANLDVMTKEHSTIAVIAEEYVGDIGEISSSWTSKGDRVFIPCTDIFDDPRSIEALKKAEGVVVGIKIGKSKLDAIQRIIIRSNKLNLKVLGYVLI